MVSQRSKQALHDCIMSKFMELRNLLGEEDDGQR